MATAADRILVVRTRFVGDTVLAIPFLRNLRAAFPAARIDVLVEKASGAVLADCPYVDELITAPAITGHDRTSTVRAVFANAAWLRGRGYDRAYVLKRSAAAILQTWLAGIPWRVGFASQGGALLLDRAVRIREHRHEVEVFLDLLRADGIAIDDARNENWVDPGVAAKVDALLAPLHPGRPRVFVAPRSTAVEKEWPVDRMAAVTRWLVEERGCEILFCGAPRDMAMHREIAERAGPRALAHVHDLTEDLKLRETGALLARSDLCLGIDTGLLHVAASYGVPVVALFGPTDPNQWHPWGTRLEVLRSERTEKSPATRIHEALFPSGVEGLRWPTGTARIDDIAVDDVMAAIDRLLPAAERLHRAG